MKLWTKDRKKNAMKFYKKVFIKVSYIVGM